MGVATAGSWIGNGVGVIVGVGVFVGVGVGVGVFVGVGVSDGVSVHVGEGIGVISIGSGVSVDAAAGSPTSSPAMPASA